MVDDWQARTAMMPARDDRDIKRVACPFLFHDRHVSAIPFLHLHPHPDPQYPLLPHLNLNPPMYNHIKNPSISLAHAMQITSHPPPDFKSVKHASDRFHLLNLVSAGGEQSTGTGVG